MTQFQSFLATQLIERKKKNPQFSLRAFAKILQMSPALLSSLISGKKRLTPKQADKIIEKLNLDEQDSTLILRGMLPQKKDSSFEPIEQQVLSEDEFKLISDWYHFAILSLGQIKNNRANIKWISHRLGIDSQTAAEAFQRLQRLKLVEVKNGQFAQTSKPLTTTTDIPSAAIRQYHLQNLQIAQEKIETVAVEEREYTAITMAVNPKKMLKAKKMMNEFKQKLCLELESDEVSEVYTFTMQFFPLTK